MCSGWARRDSSAVGSAGHRQGEDLACAWRLGCSQASKAHLLEVRRAWRPVGN